MTTLDTVLAAIGCADSPEELWLTVRGFFATRGYCAPPAPSIPWLEERAQENISVSAAIAARRAMTCLRDLRAREANLSVNLTPREREALAYAASGLNGKLAARRMRCSPKMVQHHLEQCRIKLGAGSVTQAVASALDLGILDFGDIHLSTLVDLPGPHQPDCP